MKRGLISFVLGVCFFLWVSAVVQAGPPLTNAEGVGGCALNPFAYIGNPIPKDGKGLGGSAYVGMPQIGIWKIGLYGNKSPGSIGRIDWLALGANISLFNRVELGYSHEYVDIEHLQNVGKDNFSVKANLVRDGDFGLSYMPAISVGAIYKTTSYNAASDDNDIDYYVVATKMLGNLPVPVLLNAGLLSTKGIVRGVLGFGDDRDTVFFGNIELVVLKKFILGWEFEDNVDTDDAKTHSMWETHLAYMYNSDLMLVVSYAFTGDNENNENSFGDGFVFSLQYSF
ncbi:DUF3034 family protein [Thermosulfuriphilus ammonigenes]|uniref:DUF3034 family protein n=1 Tax=Thermosulfuriphilus ammonigenes TaxID=1936021 RepID=A0A6G7PT31_9BACT|nr:DUF3034 family protein [Thermosulfuriphilus ammonigenes]MBA2849219.1 hypothetical protein [Thermosulfuriphilus ammonigenes]QIJ70834.1 DUF3034 family protein [Thermosulfuriphilus ammonigenes]